ncbi:hypothetical protein FHU34_11285 [Micromonospora taraxaci]|uniref:Uncharacterized protein n=1 Tax=Micromonospora taraxaci TaxID=1316803 RepID=A0A561VTN3_9ACTN|nr:hypothetical protein FHU34_11285 [Micromonospora taraxaci]
MDNFSACRSLSADRRRGLLRLFADTPFLVLCCASLVLAAIPGRVRPPLNRSSAERPPQVRGGLAGAVRGHVIHRVGIAVRTPDSPTRSVPAATGLYTVARGRLVHGSTRPIGVPARPPFGGPDRQFNRDRARKVSDDRYGTRPDRSAGLRGAPNSSVDRNHPHGPPGPQRAAQRCAGRPKSIRWDRPAWQPSPVAVSRETAHPTNLAASRLGLLTIDSSVERPHQCGASTQPANQRATTTAQRSPQEQ